jgi:hypothetical protein
MVCARTYLGSRPESHEELHALESGLKSHEEE